MFIVHLKLHFRHKNLQFHPDSLSGTVMPHFGTKWVVPSLEKKMKNC